MEKYRPQRIDDVVHQEEIVATLKKTMQSPENLTHLLFYGPPGIADLARLVDERFVGTRKCRRITSPFLMILRFLSRIGTGKTTTILAVCKELFGPEYIKSRVKELNASDDRGQIDTH